jgi:hypothetical protein
MEEIYWNCNFAGFTAKKASLTKAGLGQSEVLAVLSLNMPCTCSTWNSSCSGECEWGMHSKHCAHCQKLRDWDSAFHTPAKHSGTFHSPATATPVAAEQEDSQEADSDLQMYLCMAAQEDKEPSNDVDVKVAEPTVAEHMGQTLEDTITPSVAELLDAPYMAEQLEDTVAPIMAKRLVDTAVPEPMKDEPLGDTAVATPELVLARSAKDTVDEPLKDPCDQPLKDPCDEPLKDTCDERLNDTYDEPLKDTLDEPLKDTTDELPKDNTDKPLKDTTDEPLKATGDEPLKDTSDEMLKDIIEDPLKDTIDAATIQDKLEKKRLVSRAWHAKWKSAGVPRTVPESATSERAAPETHEEPHQTRATQSNLLRAMHDFVAQWSATSGLPPSSDRRRQAYAAWMDSSERAAAMATRKVVQ